MQDTAPPSPEEQFIMGAVKMRGEAEIAHLRVSEYMLIATTALHQ